MQFHILTLFPEMVENGLQTSILGRAIQKGLIGIHAVNIRDYTQDKHNKVDDYPYGGGAGMLMQAQPVYDAWKAVAKPAEGKKPVRVLFMSCLLYTSSGCIVERIVCQVFLVKNPIDIARFLC